MSSSKKTTKTSIFFLCLELAQNVVNTTYFVLQKLGVVRCVFDFLFVSRSAGSPQTWLLDNFWSRCSHFFSLVSEPGRSGPGAYSFFFACYLF